MQASLVLKLLMAVEHKHAFSSCRGNLILTEDGIEFRTTETDHSFFESYGSLRAFSLEGNELSVRTRNNKKYNFLFLNPDDVDRVRAWNSSSRHLPIGTKVD